MELRHIQIIHQDPTFPVSPALGELMGHLNRAFPDAEISCAMEAACKPDAPPDLLLVHSSSPTLLTSQARAAREVWPSALIVGLVDSFCALGAELEETLLNDVDEYVVYPCVLVDLLPRLRRLTRHCAPACRFDPDSACFEGLVGTSRALVMALERVPLLARSPANVLISGATGTGKELFARAIHYVSARHGKAFVPVNCGALPDHLFENELFGHERGAYTDASSSEKGLLALAEGGTVLLDEVDALTPPCQVKLLRFLQEHEYRPLGSAHAQRADVRVLAATNAPIRELAANKNFRSDLYYRLNVLSLQLPALSERCEDIPVLAHHFLKKFAAAQHREPPRLSRAAVTRLMSYSWPGNVRELEGVMQRVVALTTAPVIMPRDMDFVAGCDLPFPASSSDPGTLLRPAKARAVEQFERAYLIDLLTEHRGNVSQAARAAGKERRAFQRLLRKHSLERSQFDPMLTSI